MVASSKDISYRHNIIGYAVLGLALREGICSGYDYHIRRNGIKR